MKVLLLEDQEIRFETVINDLRQGLKSNGYQLIVKNTWKEAFKEYKVFKDSIDLVIIDIRGPDEGDGNKPPEYDKPIGINLYHQIHMVDPKQKVLFWTVLDKDQIEKYGVIVKNDEHVSKTADIETVLRKVDKNLNTNMSEKYRDNWNDYL